MGQAQLALDWHLFSRQVGRQFFMVLGDLDSLFGEKWLINSGYLKTY